MSFSAPLWLAALALIPIAIAASVGARRRAKRYAVRFPAVSTLQLAAAAAAGGSLRRRLPPALALAAIAALALALARPHVSYSAPVNQASIMLVTDHSGSMAATDVEPTRLAAAERAADTFIDRLPSRVRVGAVAFSDSPDAVQAPQEDHAAARAVIDGQNANGATATGDALELALQLLKGSNPKHPPSAIVLLSDGSANAGVDVSTVAREAAHDKIPINTVALGTPNGTLPSSTPFGPPVAVPPDPELMRQIAEVSGGRSFNAQSADQLSSIYKGLADRLGSVTRKREVTVAFAIGGLAFLLLAAATSTRWSGRLP
ncbi:MAG TPA: VWA domain-containing protein [Solirubrobacteraceae bacterium]|nr:VWA domain-containing protein [Solirubrobacteraceae bacterium]